MIDFTTLQGLTIPEGVVTQITDESGRVIWAVQSGEPIVLEVEKITSDTYAGETTYTAEEFILLNIYPKTNGTVSVTYGGLTKTITDTSGATHPNAQQVFFGTFNGVTDSVATAASGTLTIEGGYVAFGCGSFQTGSKATTKGYCACITAIDDWGEVKSIPSNAFQEASNLNVQELPEGIETIGDYAFAMKAATSNYGGSSMNNLSWTTAMEGGEMILPSTIKEIGSYAFTSAKGVAQSSSSSANVYPSYLAKVKILATTPPTLKTLSFGSTAAFNNDVNSIIRTIEVPKGCGEVYKAAEGWSNYKFYIVEAT